MRIIRSHDWWHYKVPPMLAVAYWAIGTTGAPPPVWSVVWRLALFVVSVIGIAGFGHVLTDAFDVREDRATGRENAWDSMAPPRRGAVVAALLASSWLPWLALPNDMSIVGLLVLEFVLFAAYAIPPLRLKERGLAGIVADALYAHVVPVLVTWLTFARLVEAETPRWMLALLAAWALPLGMRHLLHHQARDLEQDHFAGVTTFAVRRGRVATLRLITGRLLPLETVAFAALLGVFAVRHPLVALAFAAYVAWETFKMRVVWLQPADPFGPMDPADRVDVLGTRFLSRFYERWLPLVLLLGLAARAPEYLALLALHLMLFDSALGDLLRHDLPLARAHRRRSA